MIPPKVKNKIKTIEYFSKGKRSIVYTGIYKNKKVAIKIEKPETKAKNRIKNEALFLKKINKYNIGPRILFSGEKYIVYEFVKGKPISEWIKNKKEVTKAIKNILLKCRTLDKLKINKKEFTHPEKHILIDKEPKLIDFERCYITKSPKNVTQFCQFLMYRLNKELKINKKKLKEDLKNYKKEQTEKNFKRILEVLNIS